jgi:hypothetical protein
VFEKIKTKKDYRYVVLYSILKKKSEWIFFQKAPYPYCGELRWAFNPNLGGKEQSERWEEKTLSPFQKKK